MSNMSKRRNKVRPLYPVDFVDLIFQRIGNPFLSNKGLQEDEKPLTSFLWWHAGHLINKILEDGCTPQFVLKYFAPFINRETSTCMLEPITSDILTLLQFKWTLVCTTVAADLLASEDQQRLSDETLHIRQLFRLRRTTMYQVTGAVYEVLGWIAFHSGMKMQAELLWKCGADGGHPGCLTWLALQVPPAVDNKDENVYRDSKAEAEQAIRYILAARSLDRPIQYEQEYNRILKKFVSQFEEEEEEKEGEEQEEQKQACSSAIDD